MTKVILTILFLFFISVSCSRKKYDEVPNCSTIWEGNFRNVHNGEVDVRISRIGNRQTEEYKDGSIGEFKIEWLDSCQYRLTYLSGNQLSKEKNLKPVIVQITEVRENSYVFEAWNEGDSFGTYKAEMFKSKR